MNSLVREIDGLRVLPIDGIWDGIRGLPAENRLAKALQLAGCEFYDEELRFVAAPSVAVVGIGGMAVAETCDTNDDIRNRIDHVKHQTKKMMGHAAAFSYLNTSDRSLMEMYARTTDLGHFSVAHTIQMNVVLAGISEGTELELSLQRDLVHLSKLTNTRTRVQNQPPVVAHSAEHLKLLETLYANILETTEQLRISNDSDVLEVVNGLFPINKATMLMISGDLSNLRKLTALRYDSGKEKGLREALRLLNDQLEILWPDMFKKKEIIMSAGESMASPKDDYFADRLLSKLDKTDPIFAAYEAQDVSREVGFDFSGFQATLERALDEIREVLEAKDEQGDEGRAHYGDEMADIIFSLINLARHAGISDLPTFPELRARADGEAQPDSTTIIEGIGENMRHVGALEATSDDQFPAAARELFEDGTIKVIEVATAEGFDPERLLTENVYKYLKRCRDIETLAAKDDKQWADLAANNEIIVYWKRAKTLND